MFNISSRLTTGQEGGLRSTSGCKKQVQGNESGLKTFKGKNYLCLCGCDTANIAGDKLSHEQQPKNTQFKDPEMCELAGCDKREQGCISANYMPLLALGRNFV